jgi:mannose-6-phosphate isomerase-like protein (cupin superfamily)
MKVVMDDGRELTVNPGDAVDIPPGHDAWTLGDKPCVMIDFAAGNTYAK